ncbi:hypothetical protein CALCODRAFT_525150 [Calocera cornea HHB12733]|uniref:sn-1-specific diacylglycerol lipase n=1 Tax=Calocera cornea HHB12733 TaxID=1353952 RepID=A0A165DRG1_9BASI|nr:hypothetical protein CALCODRAFT_525150 [Calocera cornea HHB12733]
MSTHPDTPPGRTPALAIEGYARSGIHAATLGVTLGFGAATTGTRIGFGIARGITTTAVSLGSALLDYAWGTDVTTAATVNSAIVRGLRFAETLVLTPMQLGESLASSSLGAAGSTLDALAALLGSEEPSFTLGAFVQLVRREWNHPHLAEFLPATKPSLWDTTRALVAWASLQAVTWDWAAARTLAACTPVPRAQWAAPLLAPPTRPGNQDVHVTSNVHFPDQAGELITAEIGSASTPPGTPPRGPATLTRQAEAEAEAEADAQPGKLPYPLLRANLRRCSKLALGSYGGAGMIFFGIPMPTPQPAAATAREAAPSGADPEAARASPDGATTLVGVVQEAEVEARANGPPTPPPAGRPDQRRFWDIVWGKHDREIFESFVRRDEGRAAGTGTQAAQGQGGEGEGEELRPAAGLEQETELKSSATVGADADLPRFWVLTDHGRRQVVLVLRGTMSFKELAIDLTCEAIDFTIGRSTSAGSQPGHAEPPLPGSQTGSGSGSGSGSAHKVHSGIWKIAQEMGDVGRPVTRAVAAALEQNPGYELVLCGHSLGAAIAAMLALMWADPTTCQTVPASGLPGSRRVSAYCFAPPCVTSPELSRLCAALVVSFVFSQDLVARLSLGSVRDLFVALRKTLEANMHNADLFPTGRVLIALKQSDLPSDLPSADAGSDAEEELQVYEINDVERVFGQITFARDMLSCHLPHHYDQILHEFL